MQLLQRECGYRQTKFISNNVGSLLKQKQPIAVAITATHCITIFKSMIFDANNDETKPATTENLSLYINLCKESKKCLRKYGKTSDIKYYEFWQDKKKQKKKRTLSLKK